MIYIILTFIEHHEIMETTASPPKMLRKTARTAAMALFTMSTGNSLFRQRKFPDTARTGNPLHALQILMRFLVRRSKTNPKQTEFVKFPVILPVLREL
jgi:hypothetical protein